jgi:hypothetical protein
LNFSSTSSPIVGRSFEYVSTGRPGSPDAFGGYGAQVSSQLPAGVAARAHRALDTLHALTYFVPECDEEFSSIGLRPGRMTYFASRSAPFGAVGPEVVTATFYNFDPALVARHVPRAWSLAAPPAVLEARLRVADRALRRLLGDDAVAGAEVAEAAELARSAARALEPGGRALYAAHADLPWPDEPHLVLWHAITLLREHRGDGHVAVLLTAGLSGLEALITHTATGRGFTEAAAKATRGWSDEQWVSATNSLRERGLVDADGLTEAGVVLRTRIEAATDELAEAPWLALGADATQRLTDIGRALSRAAIAAGAFPAGLFAPRR